ncbi:MAG: hypothetical protein IPL83_03940 [Bdellovibrionales bacterium]|nr:hypothetical protein [Bdellovibrionales bacterium]
MYPRHTELAELNVRNSGSSSAWCSAHKGSAAAGRMFEDPGLLRFGSARDSLEFGTTIKQASLYRANKRQVSADISLAHDKLDIPQTASKIFLRNRFGKDICPSKVGRQKH